MRNFTKAFFTLLITVSMLFLAGGCDEVQDALDNTVNEVSNALGWSGTDNWSQFQSDLNLGNQGTGNLPASVDLRSKFPPIGNQGQYGTCVAWSVGYNLKTTVEGIDQQFTSTQLADPTYQFSPKDIFWAIANSDKGADCNGTNFEPPLDLMISRGIATMQTVPYTDLGDCSQQPPASWTQNANKYKLESYRKINHQSVPEIKEYLSQGRPISFGARLGDQFMQWNSDAVYSSDTYNQPNMQHAYHAMTLAGYDDSKGPNGSFLVVNSWGTTWGANGYIWVDYQFFVTDFCFGAFVVKNKRSDGFNPDDGGDNQVDSSDVLNGETDLLSWECTDQDAGTGNALERAIYYNVFNLGSTTIGANMDWNIVYLYYNAYDANEWGILLYDYYSDDIGSPGDNGAMSSGPGISGNWYNYVDVPGGVSVAYAVYSTTGGGDPMSGFNWGYTMPTSLNGYYYLVLLADGYDVVPEYDEANNYFYMTDAVGDPIYIQNGYITSPVKKHTGVQNTEGPIKMPQVGDNNVSQYVRNERNVNAYTKEEIRALIDYHRESGKLQEKVNEFVRQKSQSVKNTD